MGEVGGAQPRGQRHKASAGGAEATGRAEGMPAQALSERDVSEGTVSEASPEANYRREGWTLYGGGGELAGFPREKARPQHW